VSEIGILRQLTKEPGLQSMAMMKFADWPLWLQVLVGVPHALLAGILIWVWSPTNNRGWYWSVGAFVYLCLFYFIFVR
jgi:hypothetical protein